MQYDARGEQGRRVCGEVASYGRALAPSRGGSGADQVCCRTTSLREVTTRLCASSMSSLDRSSRHSQVRWSSALPPFVLTVLAGHSLSISSVLFNPLGNLIVSGCVPFLSHCIRHC